MDSNMEIRILLPADQETVAKFARERLEKTAEDPMEVEMNSWIARWRPESLAYYLPQGWSFGVFKNGQMLGFVLGQPLIFFRGLTQTLWIEELVFAAPDVGVLLLETVYKWSKDKHLQCVLIESTAARMPLVDGWKNAHHHEEPMIELRSSRF